MISLDGRELSLLKARELASALTTALFDACPFDEGVRDAFDNHWISGGARRGLDYEEENQPSTSKCEPLVGASSTPCEQQRAAPASRRGGWRTSETSDLDPGPRGPRCRRPRHRFRGQRTLPRGLRPRRSPRGAGPPPRKVPWPSTSTLSYTRPSGRRLPARRGPSTSSVSGPSMRPDTAPWPSTSSAASMRPLAETFADGVAVHDVLLGSGEGPGGLDSSQPSQRPTASVCPFADTVSDFLMTHDKPWRLKRGYPHWGKRSQELAT